MQRVLVRASVLTKVYLANVVVLDVLSNPSDGRGTRDIGDGRGTRFLVKITAAVVVHGL